MFRRGVILTGLVLAAVVAASAAAAGPSQPECVAFGYVGELGGQHYSHLAGDSYAFGETLWVFTNCPMTVEVDGQQVAYTNRTATIPIPAGIHNISFTGEDINATFENVQFVPSDQFREALGMLPAEWNADSVTFTPYDLSAHEVFIAIVTGVIVWALVVIILSRVVKLWVAYRFCEEVRA